jgi:hypothetical protein
MKTVKTFEEFVNESKLSSSANYVAKKALGDGKWKIINEAMSFELKVDDELLGIYNGMFYYITKVEGEGNKMTYTIADESFGDEEEKKPINLQTDFLLKKRNK